MKNIKNLVILSCTALTLMGTMTGCKKLEVKEDNNSEITNETTEIIVLENSSSDSKNETIPHRYASASEGIELRLANSEYFDNMSQNDLDYRTGKLGATVDELKDLAKQQGDEFTETEIQGIDETMIRIEKRFKEIGFNYPTSLEIVFVKNKMKDEYGAVAYTHGNEIYLEGDNLDFMLSIPGLLDGTIAHELFHILSRNDNRFREQMYEVFGFTLADEPEFSSEIKNILASNPDVESFDSYAMFNINGELTKATVVTLLKNQYTEGAILVDNFSTAIVPYDNPTEYYSIDEVTNFWDVFGENSNYVIAAEEGIADNFSSAVVYGMDGRKYKNPEIIQNILDVMSNY